MNDPESRMFSYVSISSMINGDPTRTRTMKFSVQFVALEALDGQRHPTFQQHQQRQQNQNEKVRSLDHRVHFLMSFRQQR